MRINKYLADKGIASRRHADEIISAGRVTINGEVATLGASVEEGDEVFLDGVLLSNEDKKEEYYIMNKPKGVMCTVSDDRGRKTVMDLLPEGVGRVFPVGRLDKDTVGVMLLTNNGPLAHSLLSPRHHVEKEYYFRAAEPLPEGVEERFAEGLTLGDGYECKSAKIILEEGRRSGFITLTEGKYHQIKRMIASFGNKVVYLERVRFGDICRENAPERGLWRYLTEEEEASLVALA